MAEILQKWLNATLGILFDIKTVSFGEILQDGSVFADLLHRYGVIDIFPFNITCRTKDYNIALKNLKTLNPTFVKIGVICKEKDFHRIARGDDTAARKLLYKLYLKLYNKNEVYFIVNKKFERKEAKSEKQDLIENYFDVHKTTKDDLKWYAERYAQITNVNKIITDTYDKYENVGLNRIHKLKDDTDYPGIDLNFSYFKNLQSVNHIVPDLPICFSEYPCEPNIKLAMEYVAFLKNKHRQFAKNKRTSKYLQKMLLDEVITTVSKKEENDLKNILTCNLMKRTRQEKQMAAKKMEIEVQKNIITQNKLLENKEMLEKTMIKITQQFGHRQHNVFLEERKYKMEQERLRELHKRLYTEKLERIHRENCKMCREICEDLVDIVFKVNNYMLEYRSDVPRRTWIEWMHMFCLCQPVFADPPNVEDIIAENPPESKQFTEELYRKNDLDRQDMIAYLNLLYPWKKDMSLYEPNADIIKRGYNILGFIVHRLLLTKYPIPKYPGIPELPSVKTAAALNGVSDELVLPILKDILERKEIVLVNTNDAINYCLQCYKNETTIDVDTKLEEQTKVVIQEKKSKKKPKGKDKSKSKKKSAVQIEQQLMVPKETQTPRLFPSEEIKLTRSGELGKIAYETLNLGLTINNYLLVQILVQYLMTMKNKKGWVFLNFPTNMTDAIILELIFSGKYDVHKEYLEEDVTLINNMTPAEREDLFKPIEDKYKTKRLSRVLPNTLPPRQTPVLDSYLTSYVCAVKNSKYSLASFSNDLSDLQSVQELYTKFGINTLIKYDEFDAVTLKQIIAAIMKDEVFAHFMYETVIQKALLLAKEREQERLAKELASKSSKKSLSDKKGSKKKGSKNKEPKKKESKKKDSDSKSSKTKIKQSDSKMLSAAKTTTEAQETAGATESLTEPKKEEETYVNLELPEDYQINLATLWESIEEVYIHDFKEGFFLRRVQYNLIAPYCQKTYDYMMNMINKSDEKQTLLHQFQSFYNTIETDMLRDAEVKTELHYRINQFRAVLWDISAQHMKECGDERIRLIKEHWFCKQACEAVALFISGLQLEMERYIRTSQFLEDYYVMMLSHEVLNSKFYNSILPPYKYDDTKPGVQYIDNAFIEGKLNLEKNMFTETISYYLTLAINTITTTYNTTRKNMKKFETSPKSVAIGKKNKKDKKKPVSLDNEDAKNSLLVLKEWDIITEGEYIRSKLRLTAIHQRAIDEINELLLDGQNLFQDIFEKITYRYNEEINSIKQACTYLKKAVESAKPLSSQLILNGANFEVQTDVLFQDSLHPPAECLYIRKIPMEFEVTQILRLYHIFDDLAPTGCMPTQSFSYLLEDMILRNINEDRPPLVPSSWTDLNSAQICKLLHQLNGQSTFVNWRDFLISIMEIPFPLESEIVESIINFRKFDPENEGWISAEDYENIQYWFEYDYDIPTAKVIFYRRILRYMFMKNNRIIYPELLLCFCKDYDPVLGFTKALEVSACRFVCWDVGIGERFIEFLKEHNEWYKYAVSTLTDMYNASKNKCYQLNSQVNKSLLRRNTQSESYCGHSNVICCMPELPGEQSDDFYFSSLFWNPTICYFLTFNFVLNVLLVLLPSYCLLPCLEDTNINEYLKAIFDKLHIEEFDNIVYAHKLLKDESLRILLESSNKFVIKSVNNIVTDLLDVCSCEDQEEEGEQDEEEVEIEEEEEEEKEEGDMEECEMEDNVEEEVESKYEEDTEQICEEESEKEEEREEQTVYEYGEEIGEGEEIKELDIEDLEVEVIEEEEEEEEEETKGEEEEKEEEEMEEAYGEQMSEGISSESISMSSEKSDTSYMNACDSSSKTESE